MARPPLPPPGRRRTPLPLAARPARPARDVGGNGLWDRPQLLNLISDVLLVFGAAGLGYAAVAAISHLPVYPLREVVVTTPLVTVPGNTPPTGPPVFVAELVSIPRSVDGAGR